MEASLKETLLDLIYLEARLLDEKRFDEWYGLFTEDALYWVPLSADQPDGIYHASLMYEDTLLLKLRVERFKAGRAHSQHPESRSLHVVQRPEIESEDVVGNDYVTRTPFVYVETRGEEQLVLAAIAYHRLTILDGQPRIRQKRINLLNADAPLPMVQLFL